MCAFTLANVELSTVGAGGHGVALTQAATAQGWVGWKRKSPQGIASDGTLGAGHDDFGVEQHLCGWQSVGRSRYFVKDAVMTCFNKARIKVQNGCSYQ